MRKKQLAGSSFGLMTIIGPDSQRNQQTGKSCYWLCRCICGNIVSRSHSAIRQSINPHVNCGCQKSKRKDAGKPRRQLTGQSFGSLSVLSFSHIQAEDSYWRCKCEACGEECIKSSHALVSGNTKSCGCGAEKNRKSIGIRSNEQLFDGTRVCLIHPSKKKSDMVGVSWNQKRKRWCATLVVRGVKHAKSFLTKDDAIAARREMEKEYFLPIIESYNKQKA